MKISVYLYLTFLYTQVLLSQTIPLTQSFEESPSDNWNYATNPVAFNTDGDVWDRVNNSTYVSGASDGEWFWEARDINEISSNMTGYLTFQCVDLTSIGACTLTFDFYAGEGFESSDGVGYEIAFDNSEEWGDANHVELNNDTGGEWQSVTVSIPPEADYLRFRLWAYTSAAAEHAGFDNLELMEGETFIPGIFIEIPTEGSFYDNSISSITISGTATNICGMIVWSNALNNLSGEIASSNSWCITPVVIGEGENVIYVIATNINGMCSNDTVAFMRGRCFSQDGPGKIAFTAFNSEEDSFSFVVLEDISAGIILRFCDEEWNGVEFGTEEDDLVWSNITETTAGSVVEFYNCDSSTAVSNNIGFSSGRLSLSQSAEGIIAYLGDNEREPTTFLAAINTHGENLNGTGLTEGETAVTLPNSPLSLYYCGARNGEKAWCDYLTLINNAENWNSTAGVTESWGDSTMFELKKTGSVMLIQ